MVRFVALNQYLNSPLFSINANEICQLLLKLGPKLRQHNDGLKNFFILLGNFIVEKKHLMTKNLNDCLIAGIRYAENNMMLKEAININSIGKSLESIFLDNSHSYHTRRLAGEFLNVLLANCMKNKLEVIKLIFNPNGCSNLAEKIGQIPDFELQNQILQILFRLRPKDKTNFTLKYWQDENLNYEFLQIAAENYKHEAIAFLGKLNSIFGNPVKVVKATEIICKHVSVASQQFIALNKSTLTFGITSNSHKKNKFQEMLVEIDYGNIENCLFQENSILVTLKQTDSLLKAKQFEILCDNPFQINEIREKIHNGKPQKTSIVSKELMITPARSTISSEKREMPELAQLASEHIKTTHVFEDESFTFTSPPPLSTVECIDKSRTLQDNSENDNSTKSETKILESNTIKLNDDIISNVGSELDESTHSSIYDSIGTRSSSPSEIIANNSSICGKNIFNVQSTYTIRDVTEMDDLEGELNSTFKRAIAIFMTNENKQHLKVIEMARNEIHQIQNRITFDYLKYSPSGRIKKIGKKITSLKFDKIDGKHFLDMNAETIPRLQWKLNKINLDNHFEQFNSGIVKIISRIGQKHKRVLQRSQNKSSP